MRRSGLYRARVLEPTDPHVLTQTKPDDIWLDSEVNDPGAMDIGYASSDLRRPAPEKLVVAHAFMLDVTPQRVFAVFFGFGVGMLLMGIGEEGGMQGIRSASGEAEPRCVSVSGPAGFEVLAAQISPDASRLALFTQKNSSDDRDVEDYVPGDRFFLHFRKMDSFETKLVENSQRIVCGEFSPDGRSFVFVTLPPFIRC